MFTVDVVHKGLRLSSRFPWPIGIVSFMAYPSLMRGEGDIVGSLRAIGEDPFFDGVEVAQLTDEQWTQATEFLAEKKVARGLQPDLLTGEMDLNSADNDARRRAVDYVKREITVASSRGIRTVALCSGPDPGVARRRLAKKVLARSLEEICEAAKGKDVEVLLETFDVEHDKKLLIGPMEEALDIVGFVRERYRNLGILWDLSHAPMLKEGPQVLRKARDALMHVHIGCAKETEAGLKDTHPAFYSKGAVNAVEEVATLIRTLLDIGYNGMVSFEVRPEEGQTSEAAIGCSKAALISAYSKVVVESLRP
ncbi:MAG: sugar phosphate isomerase/epimerase family protein [Candidatus Bathyarchaeia archaeon]